MFEFLSAVYPWTKALHVISVISWMAGLLYLPRLLVYHTENSTASNITDLLQVMERRLLRGIMNPAMILTWTFGISLALTPGIVDWSAGWPWVKGAMILVMTWFHHWLGLRRKELAKGSCTVTAKRFRLMNEVPTVVMVVIVIMIIVRPF